MTIYCIPIEKGLQRCSFFCHITQKPRSKLSDELQLEPPTCCCILDGVTFAMPLVDYRLEGHLLWMDEYFSTPGYAPCVKAYSALGLAHEIAATLSGPTCIDEFTQGKRGNSGAFTHKFVYISWVSRVYPRLTLWRMPALLFFFGI